MRACTRRSASHAFVSLVLTEVRYPASQPFPEYSAAHMVRSRNQTQMRSKRHTRWLFFSFRGGYFHGVVCLMSTAAVEAR